MKTISREEGLFFRQTYFDKARRIVIKVGSAILTDNEGMNHEVINNLAREISFLHDSGRQVILVSSGAVAAGRKKIALKGHQELAIPEKQALAAIGQSVLMHKYDEAFGRHGKKIAQILLTHEDFSDRNRYLNVRNTINTLFKYSVIPIINENDTVSVKELRFGDNDTLAAMVSKLTETDMFICLTDVSGLYNGNPSEDPEAAPIYTVDEVTQEVEAMAGNVKSAMGTGGMRSKIKAAKMVSAGGGSSFIGPGREQEILKQLFSGKLIGTFFLPKKTKMPSRKHWIAFVLKPKGKLVLDQGACNALLKKGKSLLPSGISRVEGDFETGDSVECCAKDGRVVAVGLINYPAEAVRKIKGLRSDNITDILGYKDSDEVIHRDNLVLV